MRAKEVAARNHCRFQCSIVLLSVPRTFEKAGSGGARRVAFLVPNPRILCMRSQRQYQSVRDGALRQ